jgi:hypothetical protein
MVLDEMEWVERKYIHPDYMHFAGKDLVHRSVPRQKRRQIGLYCGLFAKRAIILGFSVSEHF